MDTVILLVACPDRHGIVAKLTHCVAELDANIVDSNQFSTDADGGQFFMRLEFCFESSPGDDRVREAFAPLSIELEADCQLFFSSERPRMALAVSKFDHCLVDILYHHRVGDLAVDIPLVVSNHDELRSLVEAARIPFHHVPVTKETKPQAEAAMVGLIKESSDFLVLGRYMQILTGEFLDSYGKPVINIHHSFLPSFIGANPYQQAFDRGVKLIGATAHYVTTDLDEGPIIEQAVGKVSHRDTPQDLRRIGRDLEQQALGKAIRLHAEHRIIHHQNKTVIFS